MPISALSLVRYGATYAFGGFYLVRPEYRGHQFGIRISLEGLQTVEDRDVGLDGVVEQEPNYRKLGFETAYYNTRYQGSAAGKNAVDPRVVDLSQVPVTDLEAYDEALFSFPRPAFLRCWIRQPGTVALGIMNKDRLSGYGVLRPCRAGCKIGPLFADDPALAEALYQALSARVPEDTTIFLDVPGEEQNAAATRLARRHGMTLVFRTARMYRMRTAAALDLPLDRWFGVTSFELG